MPACFNAKSCWFETILKLKLNLSYDIKTIQNKVLQNYHQNAWKNVQMTEISQKSPETVKIEYISKNNTVSF